MVEGDRRARAASGPVLAVGPDRRRRLLPEHGRRVRRLSPRDRRTPAARRERRGRRRAPRVPRARADGPRGPGSGPLRPDRRSTGRVVRELGRLVAALRPVLSRVHVAHADAWEAEGRLRERHGGGTLAVRGLRLMASGLPQAQWNSGDVTAPDADVAAARAFYAERGAQWGVRVPVGMAWPHGRRLLTLRLMALEPDAFSPAPGAPGVAVREATPAELDTLLAIDAEAFDADPAVERRWLAPHLGAPRITTALASLDGEPAGTGYAIRTGGRAGPALYLAGVAVRAAARRRGVGAALSSWLIEHGVRDGATLAHLHADTDAAARVYARLGFADTAGLDAYVDL